MMSFENTQDLTAEEIASKKAEIRKRLRSMRRALDAETVSSAADAVEKRVVSLEAFQRSKLVLSYMPSKNELDVNPINLAAGHAGKRVAFPLCIENGGLRLLVPRSREALRPGAYGILEPDPDLSDEVTADEIDLIIVPAVAFTPSRLRLGQGGGYYDRLLEKTNAVTVGVGYDFQILDELPTEKHDRALDIVVTPSFVFGV